MKVFYSPLHQTTFFVVVVVVVVVVISIFFHIKKDTLMTGHCIALAIIAATSLAGKAN